MGFGEDTMKRWGYIGGSFSIVLGLFTFIFAILAVVLIKGTVSASFRENVFTIGILVLVLALVTFIMGILGIVKLRQAHALYLQVGAAAAMGTIPLVPTSAVAAPIVVAGGGEVVVTAKTFDDVI